MRKSIGKLTNMLTTVCDVKFKSKNCPMLPSQFLISDSQFAMLDPVISKFVEDVRMLHLYMSILGSLNWISGIRFDVVLPVTYLAWNTKAPRQHHFQVALHCAQYLQRTWYLPLVLGGSSQDIVMESFCDASLGSAPNGRSICGSFTKLHPDSGAICALSKATPNTYISIFEGELEAICKTIKIVKTVRNILYQLNMSIYQVPTIYADNLAVNNFVKGEGVANGVKHMVLRLWYVRDNFEENNVNLVHIASELNHSDKLTKVPDSINIFPFLHNILGLKLLDVTSHLHTEFYTSIIPDTPDDATQFVFQPHKKM